MTPMVWAAFAVGGALGFVCGAFLMALGTVYWGRRLRQTQQAAFTKNLSDARQRRKATRNARKGKVAGNA